MDYIIQCDNDGKPWWVADVEGDPGRTLLIENAQLFATEFLANKEIDKIIKKFPFRKLSGRLKAIPVELQFKIIDL